MAGCLPQWHGLDGLMVKSPNDEQNDRAGVGIPLELSGYNYAPRCSQKVLVGFKPLHDHSVHHLATSPLDHPSHAIEEDNPPLNKEAHCIDND